MKIRHLVYFKRKLFILALMLFSSTLVAFADNNPFQIKGAGSTFAYPLYFKWAKVYEPLVNMSLDYQLISSGEGIKAVIARQIDFGASDIPLSEAELKQYGLVQFPTAAGGIVPVVNLPNIPQGGLKLTGPVLADIFLGKIHSWNDPAILALNPTLSLPNLPILVTYRTRNSGSTYIFTNYLSKVSPDWKAKIGNSSLVNWPVGIGIKGGSEDIALYIKKNIGTIGYVEYNYAHQLNYVSLSNRAGHFILPTHETFAAAASNAKWKTPSDFGEGLTNQLGENSWPIVGVTFVLIPISNNNAQHSAVVFNFIDWGYHFGNDIALELDYVPIPNSVARLIEKIWKHENKKE